MAEDTSELHEGGRGSLPSGHRGPEEGLGVRVHTGCRLPARDLPEPWGGPCSAQCSCRGRENALPDGDRLLCVMWEDKRLRFPE